MIHQHFSTDLQTWTNAKPTNTTVWETSYVKITSEDTIVCVRHQWSVKFAVLIFHHFVFFYLLFLSVAKTTKISLSNKPCANGYTRKNGKCEGKYAKYGPAMTYTNLPSVNYGHLLSYTYETSICKLRSSLTYMNLPSVNYGLPLTYPNRPSVYYGLPLTNKYLPSFLSQLQIFHL